MKAFKFLWMLKFQLSHDSPRACLRASKSNQNQQNESKFTAIKEAKEISLNSSRGA
jgi:hypothetical protein